MTLHIAGLGPGSRDLLTRETETLLSSGIPVILRTREHPAAREMDPNEEWQSCDEIYRRAATFEDAYREVAAMAIAAARAGDVIYAVPGHPLVAERSVELVLERAREQGIDVRIHSALSFVDLAAAALGIDFREIQVCDATALRIDAQRPALIGQVFDSESASALKLALLEIYPAEHEITVLSALGTAEERRRIVPLAGLDHSPFGHLDCVFVPPLPAIEDVRRFDGLYAVIEQLHASDGCPWDREQTHASLRPHLLEETYETLEAIDSGDPSRLSEELGDVLLQVLMHAAVAKRTGEFDFADVTETIARKLVRRHPHVFGEAAAGSAEEVHRNWEALKKAEKPEESILEGIPATLPALAASQTIQGRARRVGFDWPTIDGPLEKLREEMDELARADDAASREDEFGDVLFVACNIGQRLGIDAEQALRKANDKFRRRFGALEKIAQERGVSLQETDLAGLDALWDEVKQMERAGPL